MALRYPSLQTFFQRLYLNPSVFQTTRGNGKGEDVTELGVEKTRERENWQVVIYTTLLFAACPKVFG